VLLLAIAILFATGPDPNSLLTQIQADLAAGRYVQVVSEGKEAARAFHQAGNDVGEGRAITAVGMAQIYSGDYPAALDSFNKALELARKTHNVEAEATRLNNIGNVFYFQGHYSGAIERYQEAMQLVEAHSAEKWAPSRRQLLVANTAILYQTLGQYERALDLYSQLLNAPQALPPDEEAQLLANVGTLRRRRGDPQKALQTYRATQALYKKTAHRDGEISVLNNIGILQAMDLSDFNAAIASFTTSLHLAEQSGDRPLIVHSRLYRGETYYRAGQLQKSAEDFHAAADQAASLGETDENWKALYGLARIAGKEGQTAESDQLLLRAVAMIENLRADVAGSSLGAAFLADKRDVYDRLIEHSADTGQLFTLMEKSRARNLQDRIRTSAVKDLASLSRSVPVDTAILEYWLGNDSAAVLWVTSRDHGVRRWKLSPEDLKAIASLPGILADPQSHDWLEKSQAVSGLLLADLPPLMNQEIHHLLVVPDGILSQVPFEALPDADGKLLLERFSVAYLPAASLFSVDSNGRKRLWPWQQSFEGFADPSPGVPNKSAANQSAASDMDLAATRSWPALPEAAREVHGIAAAIGGHVRLYTGPDARKQVLEQTPPAPLLHFATHAFADAQNPELSYILLAPASASSRQKFDYLFLNEVSVLKLNNVDLVTLSACETEAGKLVRGEGVASFSRAFLAAGARSVVTSLWDVSDRATAQLMVLFYRKLAQGETREDALRDAKLQMFHQTATAHPAFWAAFVLQGESQSRTPQVISWAWFAVPLLMAIAVLLLFRMLARRA
jgi:CHAT domain-containing protein